MPEALTGSTAPVRHSVRLDGQARPWHPGLTADELLAAAGLAPDAVATALNASFLPRALRATTRLQPGDELITFQPIVGG